MFKSQKFFAGWFLVCAVLFSNQAAFASYSNFQTPQVFLADKFFRTELYFGTDIAGGGKVSEEDWNKFLETEVTPRFPDGFTVLEGYGQYKDSAGKIVREANKYFGIIRQLHFGKSKKPVWVEAHPEAP